MKACQIPAINALSKEEKILLVEDLWDEIAQDHADVPIPQTHKDELDRRREKNLANPEKLLTLAELKASINNET